MTRLRCTIPSARTHMRTLSYTCARVRLLRLQLRLGLTHIVICARILGAARVVRSIFHLGIALLQHLAWFASSIWFELKYAVDLNLKVYDLHRRVILICAFRFASQYDDARTRFDLNYTSTIICDHLCWWHELYQAAYFGAHCSGRLDPIEAYSIQRSMLQVRHFDTVNANSWN